MAAEIRGLRKPDPYKQKGIRYTGEVLKKKAGKAGATGCESRGLMKIKTKEDIRAADQEPRSARSSRARRSGRGWPSSGARAHLRAGDRRRGRARRCARPRRCDKDLQAQEQGEAGANVAAAKAVGQLIATRAKEKGIEAVVFDRGGFQYHGRIKALADAAREGGLKF